MSDEQFQNPADKSVSKAADPSATRTPAPRKIQPPKGTRDLYPEDMLRRRYVTQTWRDVSIRHGFEEVDGPTFEAAELYAVKSGDGILGELFQAFSGKAEEEREQVRATGRAPFAMRPEFTPTLARMYAAKASALPRPCKWFMIGPFFRAERPQRGRLREFLQWNCDVLGLAGEQNAEGAEGAAEAAERKALMDAEAGGACVDAFRCFGLSAKDVRLGFSSRAALAQILQKSGVHASDTLRALNLLDRRDRTPPEEFRQDAVDIGLDLSTFDRACNRLTEYSTGYAVGQVNYHSDEQGTGFWGIEDFSAPADLRLLANRLSYEDPDRLPPDTQGIGRRWAELDLNIVRGLAYYTGTVFEAIADGERAVAGGGRYDKLVELFGGPPTPAVGFAMGDVVLSLLLEDKKLMPTGAELLEACSRPSASLRPEAFVVTADPGLDETVLRVTAELRRPPTHYRLDGTGRAVACASDGQDARPAEELKPWQRPAGLHARRSYKTTRNIGKLLDDAKKQHALCAVIVESAETAKVERLDTRESRAGVALGEVGLAVRELLGQIPA